MSAILRNIKGHPNCTLSSGWDNGIEAYRIRLRDNDLGCYVEHFFSRDTLRDANFDVLKMATDILANKLPRGHVA